MGEKFAMFKKIIIMFLLLLILAFIVITGAGVVYYISYPLYYKEYIGKYSNENDLDPYLVASIIKVESGYDKDALSPKNAKGLMQITEGTGKWGAEELGIADYENQVLFNPEQNIKIGTWYLRKLREEFGDNNDLILAAYNGGSGNVNKWLDNKDYSKDGIVLEDIPFKETRNYVKKVGKNYKTYKKAYSNTDFMNDNFHSKYIDFIYKIINYIRKIDD